MANYYFLISALPPIELGVKPELSFQEVKDMLILNLTQEDLKSVERLLRPIDLYNIRALWLGLPLDERGNFNAHDLEEALLVDQLPSYIAEYLERYEDTADRLKYFSSLYASLYREEQSKLTGFLLKYYQMEREIRLILTALRAKMTGRDIVRELQFEDPYEPLVADILSQKEADDFTPPQEYEDLKNLFLENSSSPQNLNRAILQYRFEKIEELEDFTDFGIDRILAYTLKLLLAETLRDNTEKAAAALEQLSQYG